MDCFTTSLGLLFHLYKSWYVTHKLFEKIKKKVAEILLLSACRGTLTKYRPQKAILEFSKKIWKSSCVTCRALQRWRISPSRSPKPKYFVHILWSKLLNSACFLLFSASSFSRFFSWNLFSKVYSRGTDYPSSSLTFPEFILFASQNR